jgi:hypothetical protein
MDEQILDNRVVERNIRRRKLSRIDYDQYLKDLEDCADFSDDMETQFERKVENNKNNETENPEDQEN